MIFSVTQYSYTLYYGQFIYVIQEIIVYLLVLILYGKSYKMQKIVNLVPLLYYIQLKYVYLMF